MEAFTLFARLVLNDEEFDKSLSGKETTSSEWGKKLGKAAATAFTAAFAAGTAALKKAIQTGMDFDVAMSGVKAIAGATEEEFAQIREKALQLGASTKFTAEEVAEAFNYMAMAGWKPEQMLDGIDGILNLAAASGEDLAGTSDIVTDALTAFGMKAEDAGHFSDVLAAAAANANTNVHMMGESFKYVAPLAGALNMSAEDVGIALGLMANNGIKASQAGTSLRRIMANLIAPSEDAKLAMGAIGVSLYDASGNVKDLMTLMTEFRGVAAANGVDMETLTKDAEGTAKRIEGLELQYAGLLQDIEEAKATGNTERLHELLATDEYNRYYESMNTATSGMSGFLRAITTITGARGLPGFLAIMNSTDEDFEKLTKAIYDSSGAAEEMSQTRLDNLAGDITILNSALEGLQIIVSDEYKNKLRDFTNVLTEQVGAMNAAFQEGGMVGMLTNLTNWMIDGITDTLTDPNITVEGANEFGEALGTFIGNLISKLVTSAPELIGGLFTAGVNLATGIVDGLLYGLFGDPENSIAGVMGKITGEEQDAIDEANSNAVKAQGILTYMDDLKSRYGEAASSTAEWATALEDLKKVFPDVNQYIDDESGKLTATNEQLRTYIENSRQVAIEDAKRKAMQEMTEQLAQAVKEQGTAEIKAGMADAQAKEAWDSLVAFIRERGNSDFTGTGMDIGQLVDIAYREATGDSEAQNYVKTLKETYEKQTKASNDYATKAEELALKVAQLQTECDIAQQALEHFAAETGGFTAPSSGSTEMNSGQYSNWYYGSHSHASGAWNIPYDDYRAVLHRGEMVLSAAQARDYRSGGNGFDEERMYAAVASAVGAAVANIQIYMDDEAVGNAVASTVDGYIGREANSARYST